MEFSGKYKTYDNQSHTHQSGALEVTVTGRGMPRDADLDVSFEGKDLTWIYSCSGKCNNIYKDLDSHHQYERGCKFTAVDMIRGGTFTGEAAKDGTDAQTTCTLKLAGE